MARMKSATGRDDIPAEAQEYHDRIVADRGRLSGPTAQLLPYAPDLAERMSHLGTYVRFETELNRAQTELATIVTARGLNNAYIWAAHVPPALEEGVSMTTVEVVNNGAPRRRPRRGRCADRQATRASSSKTASSMTRPSRQRRRGSARRACSSYRRSSGFYCLVSCIITTAQFTPRDGAPPLVKR